eukprot:931905-Pleurochrysis_carterae.AAC.2
MAEAAQRRDLLDRVCPSALLSLLAPARLARARARARAHTHAHTHAQAKPRAHGRALLGPMYEPVEQTEVGAVSCKGAGGRAEAMGVAQRRTAASEAEAEAERGRNV